MTVEELRNKLNDLLEKHPELKTNEVKIQYWDGQVTFGDECIAFDSVLDVEYNNDKEILCIEGETI